LELGGSMIRSGGSRRALWARRSGPSTRCGRPGRPACCLVAANRAQPLGRSAAERRPRNWQLRRRRCLPAPATRHAAADAPGLNLPLPQA
jgi:hypothetical protein